ncbi:MAG: hypothetical protein R3F11_27620 [Verrucomicrobiales bacterium]
MSEFTSANGATSLGDGTTPIGSTVAGFASIQDNSLRLSNDATGGAYGSFKIPDLDAGQSVQEITITFKAKVSNPLSVRSRRWILQSATAISASTVNAGMDRAKPASACRAGSSSRSAPITTPTPTTSPKAITVNSNGVNVF